MTGELINGARKELSNWDKPGGTLGKIVAIGAGIAGCVGLYKILPYLIEFTTNIYTLGMLAGGLALIAFIITNKQFQTVVSSFYFLLMRKLTGLVIELDPIAIVERQLLDMKKKIQEITHLMGEVLGLIKESKRNRDKKQAEFDTAKRRIEAYKAKGQNAEAIVEQRQLVRLDATLKRYDSRIAQSEKWYEILKQLERAAKLTVQDTENDVADRKEEFEQVKKQHKAFKSMMSIISGDPDKMALFTEAMDYMAQDISAKLGEMDNVISETGGLLQQLAIDDDIASQKADEILKRFDEKGIEAMFAPKSITQGSNNNLFTDATTVSYVEVDRKESAVPQRRYIDM